MTPTLDALIDKALTLGLQQMIDSGKMNAALISQAIKWRLSRKTEREREDDQQQIGGLIDALMQRKKEKAELPPVSEDDDEATAPNEHRIAGL